MKLTFCGAAGTTTGSQHLLEVNGQQILLDCGLYQGRRREAEDRNRHFRFDPAKLDTVVISHAHIDHTGNLPNLVKQGFSGNIYATPATRDLCSVMLPDSARIQEHDVQYLNKHLAQKGQPLLEPIYTTEDAEQALRQFITVGYHRPMVIASGVTLRYIDAGHVLGSAQVVLDIDDRGTGRHHRLLFSGDVGRPNTELLNEAESCDNVDIIIMESTYGGRSHELSTDTSQHLCEIIRRTAEHGGKVIIPAFAVERTQQLLYTLDRLNHEQCLPHIPIFVDSPLAVDATQIFRMNLESLRPSITEQLFMQDDPFGFDGLTLVREREQSMALNDLEGPAVIISASGMAENGRVLHHLRHHISDPNCTVLFVGYCAEQTLGWKLREGWKKVNILGDQFHVNARIEILDSFSGHADHSELLAWYDRITGAKTHTFIVHGEPERSEALRAALAAKHSGTKFTVAALGEEEIL